MGAVKRLFVWLLRVMVFIVSAFIVPGIVNALSGGSLSKTISVIAWPLSEYLHLMPGPNVWDGWKWAYAGVTVIIEMLFLAGMVALIIELVRLGRSRFSEPVMRSIAYMLSQIEMGIRNAWGLEPHECRFYWLAGHEREYDYFTGSHQHLNDLDKRVIEAAFLRRKELIAETNLRQHYPTHSAYEYAFIRNAGAFSMGMMVFINKQGILTNPSNVDAFVSLVEPIISVDGSKEIMVELIKKRGVIVV